MIDEAMVQAWREAAADLGIRVVAPFAFITSDGEAIKAEAFVPEFGGPYGAIALSNDLHPYRRIEFAGRFFSFLGNTYRSYDRQAFIDMLDDWGWFGEKGKEPDWYTGVTWTEQHKRDAMPNQFVLDGDRITSLENLFDEISRVLIPGVEWGRNLDALNDVLRGGFGTPAKGFFLRWTNASVSKAALGYVETVHQLELRLDHCHPSARDAVQRELMFARNGIVPTMFDWVVEIIRNHGPGGDEPAGNVHLVLE
jgi:RNAse (barnase) inhibitor barstar